MYAVKVIDAKGRTRRYEEFSTAEKSHEEWEATVKAGEQRKFAWGLIGYRVQRIRDGRVMVEHVHTRTSSYN